MSLVYKRITTPMIYAVFIQKYLLGGYYERCDDCVSNAIVL